MQARLNSPARALARRSAASQRGTPMCLPLSIPAFVTSKSPCTSHMKARFSGVDGRIIWLAWRQIGHVVSANIVVMPPPHLKPVQEINHKPNNATPNRHHGSTRRTAAYIFRDWVSSSPVLLGLPPHRRRRRTAPSLGEQLHENGSL